MVKTVLTIFFLANFSLSILGPSVETLIDRHGCEFNLLTELGEGDNKKDTEKETDKKDIFFSDISLSLAFLHRNDEVNLGTLLSYYPVILQDILSPPPEV